MIVQEGSTVKLTGIVCGLPLAVWPRPSLPMTVIVPTYVSGVIPASHVAVTLMEAGCLPVSVPLFGEMVSHAPPIVVVAFACQESVPPPVLVTMSVCVDGAGCPTMLLKDIVVRLDDNNGVVDFASIKLTNNVCVPVLELKMIVPV